MNPLTCARNWEMLRACWLALVNAGHSEKPSITKLIDQSMLKVQKHFCSLALSEEVSVEKNLFAKHWVRTGGESRNFSLWEGLR